MLGVNDERTDSYVRAIRDHVNGRTQCVVIIVPTSRDDRYSAIKRLCCIEKPVPSQVGTSQRNAATQFRIIELGSSDANDCASAETEVRDAENRIAS